jgi:hypothetical protein
MQFRLLHDEAGGAVSYRWRDRLFCGHARQARAVSSVLEQRRWHPWFGGATRDTFLARVRELPLSPAAADTHAP